MRSQITASRLSLMRLGLWGLVIASPLIALLALARPIPDLPETVVVPPSSVEAEGVGRLVVGTWLSASEDDPGDLSRWYPDVRTRGLTPVPYSDLSVTEATSEGEGEWSVTVAAATETGPRWFTVALHDDGGWSAVGLPSEVAGPAVGEAPERAAGALDRPNPRDPLAEAVTGSLRAMLTGGELGRWTHPTADLSPVSPPPYRTVELVGMAVLRTAEDRREVVAEIQADGRTMHYSLVLAARGGRWELVEILGTPTLTERISQ